MCDPIRVFTSFNCQHLYTFELSIKGLTHESFNLRFVLLSELHTDVVGLTCSCVEVIPVVNG